MCGILGILNFDNKRLNKELIIQMRDAMYHRGPDDAGLYLNESVGLAHRRLAIIDLSETGHQPMANEDKSLLLVFNGEIYNYVELRKDLIEKGHRFHSTSDTEVILHQYEEDGDLCVNKFNGMFAFILWDSKRKRFFAARDRLGIKPLYYFVDDKRIILASEIKAIIEDPSVPRLPDYHAISDYIFAGRVLSNKTMFKGVKELGPGYTISVNKINRDIKIQKYWDVHYNYNYSRKDEDLKEELFSLLDDAVKIHCRSDAPLGCHLSGGLDTSTVVALASRHRSHLETFTIKFSDETYIDETHFAKTVSRHVGADYYESSPSAKDMARLLPYLMWQMDVPMSTDGGFSYYTVSQLAHKYVKVSLTGHGGDEVFAGYPAQFHVTYGMAEMFDFFKDPYRKAQGHSYRRFIKGFLNKRPLDIYRAIKRRVTNREPSFEEKWIQFHCGSLLEDDSALHPDFIRLLEGYSPKDDYIRPFREVMTAQILDRCLYHDLKIYLPGLLHLEDRASMAVSLESRVPLLDYRIIELLATVPPEQKVRGLQPKKLLRDIIAPLLPEEIWKRRDKLPFPVPGKFWLTEEMKAMTKNILLSRESKERGIFKHQILMDACNGGDAWYLINIELWFKIFIDSDPNWLSMINPNKAGQKEEKNEDFSYSNFV